MTSWDCTFIFYNFCKFKQISSKLFSWSFNICLLAFRIVQQRVMIWNLRVDLIVIRLFIFLFHSISFITRIFEITTQLLRLFMIRFIIGCCLFGLCFIGLIIFIRGLKVESQHFIPLYFSYFKLICHYLLLTHIWECKDFDVYHCFSSSFSFSELDLNLTFPFGRFNRV
jgi:hypothetical protein